MKWILIVQLCFVSTQTCYPPKKLDIYNNYKDCALKGYSFSFDAIAEMKNTEKLLPTIKFYCEAFEEKTT